VQASSGAPAVAALCGTRVAKPVRLRQLLHVRACKTCARPRAELAPLRAERRAGPGAHVARQVGARDFAFRRGYTGGQRGAWPWRGAQPAYSWQRCSLWAPARSGPTAPRWRCAPLLMYLSLLMGAPQAPVKLSARAYTPARCQPPREHRADARRAAARPAAEEPRPARAPRRSWRRSGSSRPGSTFIRRRRRWGPAPAPAAPRWRARAAACCSSAAARTGTRGSTCRCPRASCTCTTCRPASTRTSRSCPRSGTPSSMTSTRRAPGRARSAPPPGRALAGRSAAARARQQQADASP